MEPFATAIRGNFHFAIAMLMTGCYVQPDHGFVAYLQSDLPPIPPTVPATNGIEHLSLDLGTRKWIT